MFTELTQTPASAAAARPPGTAEDWTIPQSWERFGAEEHGVWDILYARQRRKLAGRVVAAFEKGLDSLRLSRSGIPDFDDLNERLFARSGWTVVAVPGLLPDEIFFAHLARRQFPAGNFIRPASSLDYLEEPDVFHDVFGHVPMLAEPWFADFMQRLGEEGLKAVAKDRVAVFSRLYWFTVEFGVALEAGALRLYGAGLASSFGEAAYALDSARPERRRFDLERVIRTAYRSDAFQPLYFVVDGLDTLRSGIDLDRLEESLDAL
ncbi:MAG TPA: phenylalanine 4-monooxygenase [Allosphingosinicella sp.]|jgi:phenylalanine-4-hydroxylase|nr:phenylalanine 4-monooxygenase [Allosphingosinicella sp.]